MTTCKHWGPATKLRGTCALGLYDGRPTHGICAKLCQAREEGGTVDLETKMRESVAGLSLHPCLDPDTLQLKPNSPCANK